MKQQFVQRLAIAGAVMVMVISVVGASPVSYAASGSWKSPGKQESLLAVLSSLPTK